MQNLSKEIGKKVRIETIDNEIISGILMPRVELLSKDYVTIKLDNGYNIGVKKSRIKSISIIEDLRKDKLSVELKKPKRKSERKNISILATGGTIASRVDYVTGGVKAAITPEELILSVPEIEDLANISSREIFNKFSENLKPEDWITIAKEIYKEIKKEKPYGVVVTHGTDTMAYTSAALAFMLKTPVPIVLTGAQRSSDRGSSDAALNLIHSIKVALHPSFSEVCVVMHATMSDNFSYIHPATKVRKLHSSRRDAFKTVNALPLGKVSSGKVEFFQEVKERNEDKLSLDARLDRRVILLKYFPGMEEKILRFVLNSDYRGLILEGTGLGHVSEDLFKVLDELISSNVIVAMCSQTIYGRVNMNVYSTGRHLLALGVIPCEDMLAETAYVKLMWVLAHTKNPKKIREMMLTPYAREISERSLVL